MSVQFNQNASPAHFSEKYKSFIKNLKEGDLPVLPAIPDELKRAASTHRSAHGRPVQVFAASDSDAFYADYERMEFFGDSLISMAATMCLRKSYPLLTVSRMTVLKTALVSNDVLGEIARVYKLHQGLICAGAQRWSLQNSLLVQAQMFEAYVAGLHEHLGLLPTLNYLLSLMACFVDLACLELRRHSDVWRLEKASSSSKSLVGQHAAVQYVSILEEWKKRRGARVHQVDYVKTGSQGPTNACIWFGELVFDGKVVAKAHGRQWKEVKNILARDYLIQLGVPLPH